MRNFIRLLLAVLLFIPAAVATAQEKTISGTVKDADNNTPLPGVSVTIKGTNRGTQTNSQGVFSIKAQKGEVLVISSVGYEISQVTIGDAATIGVSIKSSQRQMTDVIVTAMDQKRNPRELGYSVQTVKGSDIQQTQRENFINSLQGRVAGLTVTPTGGTAGASASIVLRGFNTLSGNNQPLFIVDGVLLDNQTLNENSYSGTGVGLASDLPNRNNDYTNRIADLNPNDIESVTVLKGPEATALYGSQASSGAIVITTKKGTATNGKVLVSYDDNFRLQKVTRFVELENRYGPGINGVPTAPPLSGQFASFGPAWPSDTKFYDNIHHFFNTGFSQTHNLSADWGTKNSGFRFSGTYFDDHGTVPFNTYTKYNFKISNNTKIGKYITITPTISYINSDNLKPIKGSSGYLLDLYAWPVNNDIRNYQDANGGKLLMFNTNYNVDYDNPLWSAKNNKSGDKNSRWVGTLGIDINPFSWLTLSGRFGYDTYKQDGYLFTHPQSYLLSASTGGSLDNYYRTYIGYNHTITATAKKKFGDFNTRLLVGTMWEDFETKEFGVTGTHLKDSSSTDSSNTLASTRTRLLRNYFGLPNVSILREMAYFGEVSIGWKDLVYLTYSHRFENASPLPPQNNKYNYPGVSLSVILSDLLKIKSTFLDYAKLRASLASTARLNDPYSNQSFFVNNQSSSVLNPTYTYGYTKANPNLRPERQHTYEVGTELRFLNNAITFEAAYYNTLCTDQIVQGYRASYATGAVLNTGNAASLRNEGLEITLNLTPIRKTDFNWNVSFNFNHMWSHVIDLPAAIGKDNDFYNSDTYIGARGGLVRGHSTGTITGTTYARNNAGQILVSPSSGLPEVNGNFSIIGDRTPDFTLGTLNTFRYKNWSLSMLWDLKIGGDIYNAVDQVNTGIGKSKRTSDRTTPRVVNGVLDDGLQNTASPTPNNIVVVPYYTTAYYASTSTFATTLPNEEFIQHNVNWLKLRDVTLSYMLPEKTTHVIKGLKNLSVFVTGNDLILITNYQGADPAVIANNPGSVGVGSYGFDFGSPATPLSLSFGLRARF